MDRKNNGLFSKILTLSNLVDYQEGAVVSRTIIKKDTGNVTIFAFDKGQELSEHTAHFDAMIQILEGSAEITIAGENFNLSTGMTIIMPADKPHAVRASEKFKMLLTMIKS